MKRILPHHLHPSGMLFPGSDMCLPPIPKPSSLWTGNANTHPFPPHNIKFLLEKQEQQHLCLSINLLWYKPRIHSDTRVFVCT